MKIQAERDKCTRCDYVTFSVKRRRVGKVCLDCANELGELA